MRPAECCGVLVGTDDEIVEAVRIRNVAHEPTRYLLDPKGHIDAQRVARERGLGVVGFYHSHPHSSPEPSPTDLAEASYPDDVYLIVSLRADDAAGTEEGGSEHTAEARLFRMGNGVSTEVTLVVTGESSNRGIE